MMLPAVPLHETSMATAAALRYTPSLNPAARLAVDRQIDQHHQHLLRLPTPSFLLRFKLSSPPLPRSLSSSSGDFPGDRNNGNNNSGGGGGGGWGSGESGYGDGGRDPSAAAGGGLLSVFLAGWRARVSADPQFPFKVLMEELVGVTACVLGDMATRPNFGLNEFDFVFSTLVVGSILNFVLMYLLAPTSATAAASASLPGIFASCPPGHMFEPGAYSLASRLGTFIYKGATFAAVGLAAGLAGTAISNGLIALRKRMDPEFETPNKPPPTLLNAYTWALHMGLSSNFRYQTLNGMEYLIAKALPPAGFKVTVVGLRCLNNVLGGMSFVLLARLTGSQRAAAATTTTDEKNQETDRLIGNEFGVAGDSDPQKSQSSK